MTLHDMGTQLNHDESTINAFGEALKLICKLWGGGGTADRQQRKH